MRDLLNILEDTLTESVGLANRKPGDLFRNSDGDVLTFQSLDFFPDRGKYNDLAELDAALKQAFDSYGIAPSDITWTNAFNKGMLAFGVTHLTDDQGQDYYFGRWFRDISPNRVNNNFPNNAIPGGYRYASKVGAKENVGYKPSEVLTNFKSNTPESIYKQIVAKFGQGSPEVVATQAFMAAKNFPVSFPKGTINFTAFRDYFCEMLQPMALVMGKPVSGNAAEAANIFFGPGQGYNDCVISFNEGTTGGLYDSLLVNSQGKQIKLSSKGKNGANASVVNLRKSIRELEGTPNGKKLLKNHAEAVSILDIIEAGGHYKAPLQLGVLYKLIDQKTANEIMSLKGKGPEDIDPLQLSKAAQKLWSERSAADPSRIIPIEHMVAAVAYKVADYVNENTNFGSAASDILNNAALVQVYTEAKESKDVITITGFRAIYPSKTVTGVLLDASKAYFSTGNKGNFTFKILKNGASVEDLEMQDNVVDTKPDPDPETNLVNISKRRSNIKASGLKQPEQDVSNLGRKRRKPI